MTGSGSNKGTPTSNDMRNIPIIALLVLLPIACSQDPLPPVTLHLVGDSTMAHKPDPDRNPERGWGQLLPRFFNEKVTVVNHAVNGRSTLSFINEGKWNAVLEALRPGDYVLIQFGHNDQKAYDPNRYANAYSAYRRNLEQMCRETLAGGGHPVILSSIVRRNFNEEGTLEDTHGPYPFVARSVALELGIPFIDLQQQTEDLVSGLGPVRSATLFLHLKPGESELYPGGLTDNTHLNTYGATEVAGMVARSIHEQGLPLSAYLDPVVTLPRVLVVTGGHSYDTAQFVEIFRSMDLFPADTLSHPHADGLLASEHIWSYDVVLFYDYRPSADPADSVLLKNLARKGMPMFFMHHAICSFQGWSGFGKVVGGHYVLEGYAGAPVPLSTYAHDLDLPVGIVDPGHPVTAGLEDFVIRDEGYLDLLVMEGITPLLVTGHSQCTSPLAWINRYGESTVVYLMLGHDRQAYGHPSFRQLVVQTIAYLAGTRADP